MPTTKRKSKNTSVRFSADLLEVAEDAARRMGTTLNHLVSEALVRAESSTAPKPSAVELSLLLPDSSAEVDPTAIRVSPDTHQAISRLSARWECNRSSVVRGALARMIESGDPPTEIPYGHTGDDVDGRPSSVVVSATLPRESVRRLRRRSRSSSTQAIMRGGIALFDGEPPQLRHPKGHERERVYMTVSPSEHAALTSAEGVSRAQAIERVSELVLAQ